MVKEYITSAIKKVTLDLIYQVVDERTEKINDNVEEVKKQQREDFRYLVQKIDTNTTNLRNELGLFKREVKVEFSQLRNEFGQLRNEVGQLNQRIDTVIQMLINIKQHG